LFTAANPAIQNSGLPKGSKSELLDVFKESPSIAPYKKITFDDDLKNMVDKASHFIKEHGLHFPVVLKPDTAREGRGGEVIKDRYAMQDYLDNCSGDVIIQEYVEGEEVEIVYYQKPNEERGHIFSITKKERPQVVADGKKTVQELILSDDETVTRAKEYLEQNEDRLYKIPDEGEVITLVDIGTYARGAIFSNNEDLITEPLTEKMHTICKSANGFNIGRFDIIVPDYELLKQGKGLKVIEVSDITSRPAVTYDKSLSFIEGQKMLMRLWAITFEIGDQQRDKGEEVTQLLPFLKQFFNRLTTAKKD
jgi:hypothetical protein